MLLFKVTLARGMDSQLLIYLPLAFYLSINLLSNRYIIIDK